MARSSFTWRGHFMRFIESFSNPAKTALCLGFKVPQQGINRCNLGLFSPRKISVYHIPPHIHYRLMWG